MLTEFCFLWASRMVGYSLPTVCVITICWWTHSNRNWKRNSEHHLTQLWLYCGFGAAKERHTRSDHRPMHLSSYEFTHHTLLQLQCKCLYVKLNKITQQHTDQTFFSTASSSTSLFSVLPVITKNVYDIQLIRFIAQLSRCYITWQRRDKTYRK